MLAFFVGLVPTAFTISLTVPFSYHYIRYHRWRHRKAAPSYKSDTMFQHTPPRMRIVARSIVISVFGIISLIVSIAGVNRDFLTSNSGLVLLIFSTLPAIFFAPSLNITSWIMTRKGIMYENRLDGTRLNMGDELRRSLESIIGPIALVNFGRVMYGSFQDPGLIAGFVGFTLILSIPSAVVTVLLLRRKTLAKLTDRLGDRLNKCNIF